MLFIVHLKAQYYYYNNKYYDNAVVMELGVSGGMMNALTDLGGKKGIGKTLLKTSVGQLPGQAMDSILQPCIKIWQVSGWKAHLAK